MQREQIAKTFAKTACEAILLLAWMMASHSPAQLLVEDLTRVFKPCPVELWRIRGAQLRHSLNSETDSLSSSACGAIVAKLFLGCKAQTGRNAARRQDDSGKLRMLDGILRHGKYPKVSSTWAEGTRAKVVAGTIAGFVVEAGQLSGTAIRTFPVSSTGRD